MPDSNLSYLNISLKIIHFASPIVMNGSVLYLLPTKSNSNNLTQGIPKTRSLSDLEMVLNRTSDDLSFDRHNSVSGVVNMNTTVSSTAPAVEALVGPFKTLEDAQVAACLLEHKTTLPNMPISINLHQNFHVSPDLFQTTKSSTHFNSKQEVSKTSIPHVTFPKNPIWTQPLPILPTNEHGNNQVCSANLDATKMKFYSSVTSHLQGSPANKLETLMKPQSYLPSSTDSTTYAGIYVEDSVTSPGVYKNETKSSSVEGKKTKAKESISSVTKVETLVFFDLETTGLAFEIGKSNVQITEVSMIAISRKEFEQSTYDDLRDIRIIQKLCLCTRPRSRVSSSAAAITGLNNENLMDQTPFECNAAETINFFLSHLPKPVCLLAHNGNRYDFPLIKAEFSRLSMSLPPDILVADTLKAFRALGVPVFPPEKKICKSVKFTKKGQVSYSLSNLHLYFFNKNPTGSHSSEGDCIALAKVCHRMKDLMLSWIDENCTGLDSVSLMW